MKTRTLAKILDVTERSIQNYKKKYEKKLIIDLLDKYFLDFEIEEFISTGKIQKLENFEVSYDILVLYFDRLISIFMDGPHFNKNSFNFFIDFLESNIGNFAFEFHNVINSYNNNLYTQYLIKNQINIDDELETNTRSLVSDIIFLRLITKEIQLDFFNACTADISNYNRKVYFELHNERLLKK